jgi:acyl carrier protein
MIDKDKIITHISEKSGVPASQIEPSSQLTADCNLTPLEIVDLMTALSKEFHVPLPDDLDFDSIATVSDLIEFIDDQDSEL